MQACSLVGSLSRALQVQTRLVGGRLVDSPAAQPYPIRSAPFPSVLTFGHRRTAQALSAPSPIAMAMTVAVTWLPSTASRGRTLAAPLPPFAGPISIHMPLRAPPPIPFPHKPRLVVASAQFDFSRGIASHLTYSFFIPLARTTWMPLFY